MPDLSLLIFREYLNSISFGFLPAGIIGLIFAIIAASIISNDKQETKMMMFPVALLTINIGFQDLYNTAGLFVLGIYFVIMALTPQAMYNTVEFFTSKVKE